MRWLGYYSLVMIVAGLGTAITSSSDSIGSQITQLVLFGPVVFYIFKTIKRK